MRRCFAILTVLVLAGARSAATAEEPRAWVDRLLAAARAKDEAGLRALAKEPELDPWRAVDRLHAASHFRAAKTFASALPEDVGARHLIRYSAEARDAQVAARRALATLDARLQAGRNVDLAAEIRALDVQNQSILAIEARLLEARAHSATGNPIAAAVCFGEAGSMALQIGWMRQSVDAFTKELLVRFELPDDRVRARRALRNRAKAAEQTPTTVDDQVGHLYAGALLAQAGRPQAALPWLRRAIDGLSSGSSPGHLAQAHATLSQALVTAGQYGLALHHSERAQTAFAKLGFAPGVLYARSGAIAACTELGLDEETIRLARIQEREAEEAGALDDTAQARLALAIAESRLEMYEKGEKHFAEALAYFTKAQETEQRVLCLLNRGRELHLYRGHLDESLRDFRRAVQLTGDNERLRAYALVSSAEALGRAGRWSEIQDETHHALEVAERIGDRALAALAQTTAAEHARARGAHGAARIHALDATRELLSEVGNLGLTEGVGLLGLRESVRATRVLVAASLALADDEQIFEAVQLAGAVTWIDNIGGWSNVRRAGVPADAQRRLDQAQMDFDEAQQAVEIAREAHLRAPTARARLREAELALANANASVQREVKRLAEAVIPARPRIEALQAWLRPNEVFVRYFVVDGDIHALVVGSARAERKRVVTVAQLDELKRSLDALRTHRTEVTLAQGIPTAIVNIAHRVLGSLAIAPECKRLIVAPAPELANLPWPLIGHAIGDRTIVVTPSAGHLLAQAHAAPSWSAPRLLVGVANYRRHTRGGATRVHAPGGRPLRDLPGAAKEVHELARTELDRLLVNNEASEEAVEGQLREHGPWSMLHFACHGLLHRRRPSLSSLALTPGPGDDGFLTIAEVLSLPMHSDLVVLSACDVGSSRRAADTYIGLPPAILAAGGRRVLCNLWRVGDEPGRVFMRMFYAALEGAGRSPAQALRETQRRYAREHPKWKHPYYWAGWVLWGTPR